MFKKDQLYQGLPFLKHKFLELVLNIASNELRVLLMQASLLIKRKMYKEIIASPF